MTDNYDQLALSWVRKEINNTLDQARQGLESFAEDNQDQTQIQFCINCLHQVQGTLQMLEFSGAAKLASEMEGLAEKMSKDPLYVIEPAFEVLMRALLQMPGYLERVEDGQKDIPVILLPLINEIRAASNQAPMTERDLFSADTSGVAPPKAIEKVSQKDKTSAFQDNAKKLRAHFQKGLTGIIRGQKIKESLSRIHKVLLRLEALTENQSVAKLWWVADGFIFSITEGGLYKKKEIHQLLARVDKQIKRLSDEGANALNDVIPESLLSQLLYFVARSKSKNDRVRSLKKEFALESVLADSEQIKKGQAKLAKPDTTAVTNVAGAINEELATVKDQLDLFVRAKVKSPAQLETLVVSLTRISDTLTLLELAIPRDVIRQQTKQIQKIIDRKQMPDDATVMDIAGALLFVEANLKDINLDAVRESIDEAESSRRSQVHAKETQVDEATQTLIKVARKSMQVAKDKVIHYVASGFDQTALIEVPVILEEVLGGVKIVQFDLAAELLQIAKGFIEQKILKVDKQPKEEYLDALADVITSVEYFLEASEEGKQRGVSSILKGAEESVSVLNSALQEKIPTEPLIEVVADKLPALGEVQEVASSKQPEPEKAPPVISSAADKQVDETLIDEEVLEIFLEEAEEEIEIINDMLPRWTNNLNDGEAITILRRSFHTLKGSGRLVGAKIIGEVSWAVENMLNKVIEESIPAEIPVISVLNDVHLMLPSLVDAFSKQQVTDCPYQELIDKAEHIAAGKPLAEFDSEKEVVEVLDTQEPISGQHEGISEEIEDPVLLEIFSTEAYSHLETINQYLNAAPGDGSVAVTDELIRALHTLKGSAHMAGVEVIANLTAPWEKYARLVKGSGHRFDQLVVGLLKQTHEYIVQTLSSLKNPQPLDANRLAELQQEISQLELTGGISSETTDKQRDQRFVSIFLTEGLDILHEVTKLNDALEYELSDDSLKESIRAELNTFHRGAEMVAIDELETLADSAETLATYATNRGSLSNDFHDLLTETVDKLTEMLNRIATDEDLESPHIIVEKINNWIDGGSVETVPEDMDVELVELFVEEGEELVESARELLTRWQDNITSKEITTELRRIYHTIKGSSRMAGAMNIGDLAFAAENIFNTIIEFARKPSLVDHDITQSTTDKLEAMVAELKTLRWPSDAAKEIQIINRRLSPEPYDFVDPATTQDTVTNVDSPEGYGEIPTVVDEVAEEIPTVVDEVAEEIPAVDDEVAEEIPTIVDEVDDGSQFFVSEDFEPETKSSTNIEGNIAEEAGTEFAIDIPVAEETDSNFQFDEGEFIQEGLSDVTISEAIGEEGITLEETVAEEFDEEGGVAEGAGEEEITVEEPVAERIDVKIAVEEEITVEGIVTEQIIAEEHDEKDGVVGEATTEEVEEEEAAIEEIVVEGIVKQEVVKEEVAAGEGVDDEVGIELLDQETTTPEVFVENTVAPSSPIVASGNSHKVDLDEDGEEVLEIYLEEAEELLIALDEALHEWSKSLDNKNVIDLLQRTLHTFKGGARLSDLVVLGDLTHEMETYFERINSGKITAKPQDVDFLLQGYDAIASLVNEVRDHRQMTVPEAYLQSLDALIKGEVAPSKDDIESPEIQEQSTDLQIVNDDVGQEQSTAIEKKSKAQVVSFEEKKQQAEIKQKQARTPDIVRVTSEQLENLVNLAGETSIFRSRLEQQMSVLRYNLDEMSSTVERLRDQLRNLDIETDAQISYRREVSGGSEYEDFDPLEMDRYTRQQELTRGLSESAVDLLSLKDTLDSLTADSETLLLQQGRVNTEMQESLMSTRMIPFESLVPRLRRMVRQISTELGKTIELNISADGEMDRTVLERLVAPLEHMLRNAMDHGIETPEERRASRKHETGSVKISLYREGSEVFVKIQDDGRGLNLNAIRTKAIEKGLINESSELSAHELQQLILEAGFSTAEQVTQISGRGVGLDVVSAEIKQLGGVIEIDSNQGFGTTFTVKLPFSVSVNHALMVQLGDETFAIPLANIEGIVRVSPFELEEYYANESSPFEYAGIDYSMYYLGQLLDHNRTANLQGVTQPLPVLLLHGADHPTALQVDVLLGSREIVVKSIGSQLSSISGLSGATILGDGRVVLILDMPALIRRIDATVTTDAEVAAGVDEDRLPLIMVVDDSITVRKVTSRLLARNDFEVITAKDGVDALSVLGERKPDVMLLDIEMPRMDGFELATIIRHDDQLKDLPIIMITSRTGGKHRERAEQIGVNRYMGKPYNEVDLIDSISALLLTKT